MFQCVFDDASVMKVIFDSVSRLDKESDVVFFISDEGFGLRRWIENRVAFFKMVIPSDSLSRFEKHFEGKTVFSVDIKKLARVFRAFSWKGPVAFSLFEREGKQYFGIQFLDSDYSPTVSFSLLTYDPLDDGDIVLKKVNSDVLVEFAPASIFKFILDSAMAVKAASYILFYVENMAFATYLSFLAKRDNRRAEGFYNWIRPLLEELRVLLKNPTKQNVWEMINKSLDYGMDPF